MPKMRNYAPKTIRVNWKLYEAISRSKYYGIWGNLPNNIKRIIIKDLEFEINDKIDESLENVLDPIDDFMSSIGFYFYVLGRPGSKVDVGWYTKNWLSGHNLQKPKVGKDPGSKELYIIWKWNEDELAELKSGNTAQSRKALSKALDKLADEFADAIKEIVEDTVSPFYANDFMPDWINSGDLDEYLSELENDENISLLSY